MKNALIIRGAFMVLLASVIMLTACSPDVGVQLFVSPDSLDFGKTDTVKEFHVVKNYSGNSMDPIVATVDQPWMTVENCASVADNCMSSGPLDKVSIPVRIDRDGLEVGLNSGHVYVQAGSLPMVTVPVVAEELAKADFRADVQQIKAGEWVAFQDLSRVTEESGNVQAWRWDFGDGSTSTLKNPAHTYTRVGEFTVSLHIKTTRGFNRTATKTSYIQVGDIAGAVDFNASQTRATVGDRITFTDNSTIDETAVVARQWDFGDNSFSSEVNPAHVYQAPGIYTVALTLTTADNTFTEVKENYIVVGNPLNADFTYDNAFVGEDTEFFPFIFGEAGEVSYVWNFGDGTVSSDEQPRHRFPGRGEYEVVLKVTDGSGFATVQKKIAINYRPPQVLFIAEPTTQSKGKEIEFFDRTIGGYGTVIDWVWDFGDGSGSTEQHPKHTYERPGFYTVSLEVISAPDGQKGKLVKKNYIEIVDGPVEGEGDLALDDYINTDDGCFDYTAPRERVERESGYEVATAYLIDKMTSQCWNPDDAVYEGYTEWTHPVTIVEPKVKMSETAMLFIDGGSRSSTAEVDEIIVQLAVFTGTTIVHLKNVPSQPIVFKEEVIPPGQEDNNSGADKILRSRTEDAIIAYSYDEFLRAYRETDGKPTNGWPLLFPMVKSAVKAMDMTEEILAKEGIALDGFVVTGASKRGWTTWLTGAVDSRVKGIAPIVINVLNMKPHLEHHRASYGYWSPAIYDYAQEGIFDQLISTVPDEELSMEAQALLERVDPYQYALQGRYENMPKLMINATGDEFFIPDTTQYYFDELPAEKHLSYLPNVGHSMGDWEDIALTDPNNPVARLLAWYMAVTQDVPLPEFAQTFEPSGAITVEVDTDNPPVSVRLWQMTTVGKRDFRFGVVEQTWTSEDLKPLSPGVYTALPDAPEDGSYTGFFIELRYSNPANLPLPAQSLGLTKPNFVFTTGVRVLPVDTDGDPTYPDFKGYLANEERSDAVPFSEDVMPVIALYGTPEKMGEDYGQLLRTDINAFIPEFISEYMAETGETDVELMDRWKALSGTLDKRILSEIDGIVETSHVDLSQLQMAHAAAIYGGGTLWNSSGTMAYGALLTDDSEAVHGVTVNSVLGLDLADKYLCAILYIPNKGAPHTVFTYPGLAVGYTGINLGGISANESPDPAASAADGNALPVMRSILYDAFSLRSAIDMVEAAPPLNTSLVLGDGRNEMRGARVRTDDIGLLPLRYDLVEDLGGDTPGIVFESAPDVADEYEAAIQDILGDLTLEGLLGLANSEPFAAAGENILNVAYESVPLNIQLNKAEGSSEAFKTSTEAFNMQALLP